MTRAPSKTQLYQLGVQINPHMSHYCTFEELAAELGTTKQLAYHEAMRALGKLAWMLRDRLQLPRVQVQRVPCRAPKA